LSCAPQKIPSYIEALIFTTSDFSKPVTLEIPLEDKAGMADDIRKTEEAADRERGIIPRLIFWQLSMDKHSISQNVLDFLTQHNYLRVDTVSINIRRQNQVKEFKLLYYNDKIRPHLVGQSSNSSLILLGSRQIKSIDYTNQYQGTLLTTGAKTQFYALTFSYVLKAKLPELPQVNKVFQGKAKVYLDPDDGKWKFWYEGGLVLEDRGAWEYTELMKPSSLTGDWDFGSWGSLKLVQTGQTVTGTQIGSNYTRSVMGTISEDGKLDLTLDDPKCPTKMVGVREASWVRLIVRITDTCGYDAKFTLVRK
jgi:hypothetical protein